MMIVLPLLVAIKNYLTKYQDESPDMEIVCPYCGRRLRRHGRYFRRVVLGTVLYRIPVYRRLCSRCRKTFSLCPCFLRPYSQFALPVHEAAARLLVQGRSPDRVSELLCQGPGAGGVSGRTILRWQRRRKDGASGLLSAISGRVLALSPGTDLTPYLPPPRMPRGSLQALFSLGGLYCDTLWGPRRPPLFPFLRLSLPSGAV